MIEINFSAEMKKRFLSEPINRDLSKKVKRFFATAGGSIRTTARRLLKRKASKSLSELTESERVSFLARQRAYKKGLTQVRPVRPDKTSLAGEPPRLHDKKSLLKERLFFALTADQRAVVVGPELLSIKQNGLKPQPGLQGMQALERNNPFMAPALRQIIPRLPAYLAKSVK